MHLRIVSCIIVGRYSALTRKSIFADRLECCIQIPYNMLHTVCLVCIVQMLFILFYVYVLDHGEKYELGFESKKSAVCSIMDIHVLDIIRPKVKWDTLYNVSAYAT